MGVCAGLPMRDGGRPPLADASAAGQQVAARDDGHAGLARGAARRVLVAHALDDLGIGANEHEAALAALASKCAFSEKNP